MNTDNRPVAEELVPINLKPQINELKNAITKQFGCKSVKFVGMSLHFLMDDATLMDIKAWGKNFNPDDYEDK